MQYDNLRDRTDYGYDAGTVVDGVVTLDSNTGEYVIVDDDGIAFSSQRVLSSLTGKQVRITCISFEAIQTIEAMLRKTQSSESSSSESSSSESSSE